MQRRHFLVREIDGEYKLREIAPLIADALAEYGIQTGSCYTVKSIHWTFYFMNCHIPAYRADQIASELTQDFLSGKLV